MGAADTADTLIHDAIFDVAMNLFNGYLREQFPWLNLPILSPLLTMFLNHWFGLFYVFLSRVGVITVVNFQTDNERKEYEAAEGQLRQAHLKGDPNEISKATESFRTALGSLISWDLDH